jgi:hypothetical protein
MIICSILLLQSFIVADFATNVVFLTPDDSDQPSSTLTPNFDQIRSGGVVLNRHMPLALHVLHRALAYSPDDTARVQAFLKPTP